jgi:DNA-binding response OmpR family regulator
MLRNPHFQPHLIVLDLNIPKIPGTALLQRWKGNHRTPVVVLSSSRNPAERDFCLAYGACEFVTKPVVLEEFQQAVGRIIERWASKRFRYVAPWRRVSISGLRGLSVRSYARSEDADRTISRQSCRVNSRTTAPPGVSSSTTCAVARLSVARASAARSREVYSAGSRRPSARSWKYRDRISGKISFPLSVRTLSFGFGELVSGAPNR